jgi:hypothetical protein
LSAGRLLAIGATHPTDQHVADKEHQASQDQAEHDAAATAGEVE